MPVTTRKGRPPASGRRPKAAAPSATPSVDTDGSMPPMPSDPISTTLRVLHVCAEMFPLLKTGGLADVAGALPFALNRHGADARVLLPGFPTVLAGLHSPSEVARVSVPWPTVWGEPAEAVLLFGTTQTASGSRVGLYAIDAPFLYDRPGNPYADARQQPYQDNHRRFALLSWIGAQLAQGLDPLWRAQCLHSHDWHAGLTSAYLAAARMQRSEHIAASVYTVHNLAYQGLFSSQHLSELGLPASFFGIDGLEFHGQISFMKAGLYFSDRITTVSPTYAREIQTPEQGHGLDGLLRSRATDVRGILNGVDDAIWDPASDALIDHPYDRMHLSEKMSDKAALQKLFGLADRPDALLFTVVSRLTSQKGLHLVLAGLDDILARGGQVVVLGSGDPALEAAFAAAAGAYPQAVGVRIGYDETLSHQVFAGGDVIMVPSHFEPCGLTQLYGLKYGCLPLVRRVGGLADTVVDCSLEELVEGRASGFVFEHFDSADFSLAVRRAFALYKNPTGWQKVRQHAMAQDFGWDASALEYMHLYREIST